MNIITESKINEWIWESTGKMISNKNFKENKILYLKKYLSELLDPIDSDEYDLPFDGGRNPSKVFTIGGDTFKIEAEPSRVLLGFWKFSFKLINSTTIVKPTMDDGNSEKYIQNLNAYEYGLTNTGNPIQILKTIQSFLYKFIKKQTPRGISFKDYDEGLRTKTYSYMAKKIARKSGYFWFSANNYFFIFKDKDDMEKVRRNITASDD